MLFRSPPKVEETVDPYSYFEYQAGNPGNLDVFGTTFYTQNRTSKEYEVVSLTSEVDLEYYSGASAPNLYVKQQFGDTVNYVRAKLAKKTIDPMESHGYIVEGTTKELSFDDVTFYTYKQVMEPQLDSEGKPEYDDDNNPIMVPKDVYTPFTVDATNVESLVEIGRASCRERV